MRTEEFHEKHRKKTARVRSVVDYTMGILLFLIGLFFLTYGWLGITIREKEHGSLDYLIGFVFSLYGLWRIYRGYKKDY